MPFLEFRQFSCVRNDHPLFRPLDLALAPGALVQITGPNGAGKTTFLRAAAGLFDNTAGHCLWRGVAVNEMAFERAEALLYLGHAPGVKGSLTASENLRWFCGLHQANAVALERALAEVGLAGYEDTPCLQLSAGQQRRVALARLYCTHAPVWILDEPFTAIDTGGVRKLEALLEAHAAAGGAALLTSHQPIACAALQTVPLIAAEEIAA